MHNISFSFSGWVSCADISTVTVTATGVELDVTDIPTKEVVEKLESHEWCISLADHLYSNRKNEVEIFDFEESI